MLDAKNYAKACPILEQVAKLVPTGIGSHGELSKCYEGQKRLASAWGQYRHVAVLAQAAGQQGIATAALANAARLKPMLATVKITVPDEMRNVAGLSVAWDGIVQEQGSWGTPFPVDAGKHVIEIKAPMRQTWTREVFVVTDGVSMEEKVPILKVAVVKVAPRPDPVATSRMANATWMRPVGAVGVGIGGAGIALGGVLAALASSRFDASNIEGECNQLDICNARGVALRNDALLLAQGATAAMAVGGTFAVTGTVLLALSRIHKKDSALTSSLQVTIGPTRIDLRGGW